MARHLRIEHAGGWYHITARGNERRPIFRDDRDRNHFLELLGRMVERFSVSLHAYVLMDNHYHLILQLSQCNLSLSLQWLNLSYSAWFNRRHERSGHLFQGRFKSILFDAPTSSLEISRYIHLNPVRTNRLGLGKSARAAAKAGGTTKLDARQVQERIRWLRNYRWSSYRAYIGVGASPEWLTCGEIAGSHHGNRAERQERYRDYVESAAREGLDTTGVWGELKEGAILGGARFVRQVRDRLSGDHHEQRAANRLRSERVEWRSVVAAVEKLKTEKWEQFRERHGDGARDMALYLGRQHCGMKLKELAQQSGLKSYGAAAMAIKRYEKKLSNDRAEAVRMNKIIQMLNVKM